MPHKMTGMTHRRCVCVYVCASNLNIFNEGYLRWIIYILVYVLSSKCLTFVNFLNFDFRNS